MVCEFMWERAWVTGMYNLLEALRDSRELTAKEQTGQVRWLRPEVQNAAANKAANQAQSITLQNQELIANVLLWPQADLTPKNDPNTAKLAKPGKKDLPQWPSTLAGQVSAAALGRARREATSGGISWQA